MSRTAGPAQGVAAPAADAAAPAADAAAPAEDPVVPQRDRSGRLTRLARPADRRGRGEGGGGFTAWRRRRPFIAGLLMILAGTVIMVPAYLSFEVSNIQIQISSLSGVSTLVIGVLLITCGLITWLRGEGRLLAGVTALILAVVALPTSNFGGFLLGTVLALIGGALALSWTDQPAAPAGARHRGNRSGGAVAAGLAALAGTGLLVATPADAHAQLPGIPGLQDILPAPGQAPPVPAPPPVPQNGDGPAAPPAPVAPAVPDLPSPEDLGLPAPPPLPDPGQMVPPPAGPDLPELPELPEGLVPARIGGFDTTPPEPIADMPLPPGSTYTVRSDSTRLLGNVKMSFIELQTAQGPKPAIRIDADRVVLDNLNVRFPGELAGAPAVWQRTGPGEITTLNGNFHIIVASLEVTPQLAGVTLPAPIRITAADAPEELARQLRTVGAGLPDELSAQQVMLNNTMETYYISSDDLRGGPATSITPES